ncbi:MAG: SixA phosphatase family protein [Bacteroidia bacterium]
MKTLYLIRHAKSDWAIEGLSDIFRPLNSRGYSDAHKMALVLKEKKILPELIITSPAIRAISTALIFSKILNYDPSKILINKNLYDSSVKDYSKVVSEAGKNIKSVMLFGHNPVITQFANSLTASFAEEMATCCIVGIKIKAKDRGFSTNKMNELFYYDHPKKST